MKEKIFRNPNEVKRDLMREDRMKANIDQEAIADVVGVSPTTISSWESFKRTPKVHHVVKFAEVLGHDPRRYVEGNALQQVVLYRARASAIKDFVRGE